MLVGCASAAPPHANPQTASLTPSITSHFRTVRRVKGLCCKNSVSESLPIFGLMLQGDFQCRIIRLLKHKPHDQAFISWLHSNRLTAERAMHVKAIMPCSFDAGRSSELKFREGVAKHRAP